MLHRNEPDVLVAGAGPVGLFSALRLARAGVRVQIVDRERDTAANSYALALHPRSVALLDEVGLAGEVLRQAVHVKTVAFYQGSERKAELPLSELGGAFREVVVLPQNVVEDLLVQALIERRVPVLWNHRLGEIEPEGDRVRVGVDRLGKHSTGYASALTEWVVEKTLQSRVAYVIGADGHDSFVRRRLGLDYEEVGPSALFAVFEFSVDAPVPTEVRVVLDESTTSVLWPLPGGRCRWSFEVKDGGEILDRRAKSRLAVQIGGRAYPYLDASHLTGLIRERAPWFTGTPADVHWSLLVRFERRLASGYGAGHTWLAGDAVHMTGPVGVQSMNVGMREAAVLTDALVARLGGGGGEALQEYERRFLAEWRTLLGLGASGGPVPADPWLAARSSRLLSCIPASGDDLTHLVSRIRRPVAAS
ncbi:MAG TPA: NAD(P)/FAD-dependent oxidoreductase [Candidatus Polarisedimenticolaceae bacterium]|nr:NAD(P)/FAD-dependent oxidoreductase [Candidatus Polarisedimenticolaceae bacterium]